jgi:DNA-binding winged helix-turn-helix (wHTH) protein/tetratricopeptide (TPR) repeat protein
LTKQAFRVGSWLVHPASGMLSRDDAAGVRVRARIMEVLVFFAGRPGEVITKDTLLDQVWGTDAISESALTRTISELRQALGDDSEHPVFLETIPKRGYRLIAPVTPIPDSTAAATPSRAAPADTSAGSWTRRGSRRRPSAALAAAMVVLLLAGLWGARRLFWNSSPFSFAPEVALAKRDWVLVTAFENRTGRQQFDGTVEHALEHEVSMSTHVNVAPRQRVEDTLQLMLLPATTQVDARLGREIALRDGGIRRILTGTIDLLGGGYALTVQLVAPGDGTVLASRREEVADDAEMPRAIRRLSIWTRTVLGETPLAADETDAQLAKATTRSLRGLRLYSEGLAAFNRAYGGGSAVGFVEAEALLSAAVLDDPDFAAAHLWLAYTRQNLGRAPQDYMRSAERAAALARRATDRERYFILAGYYGLAGHEEQAMGAFQALLRLYPDDYWSLWKIAVLYMNAGLHDQAADAMIQAAGARPNDAVVVSHAASHALWTRGVEFARPYAGRVQALLDASVTDTESSEPLPVTVPIRFMRGFLAHDLWLQRRIPEAIAALEAADSQLRQFAPADRDLLQRASFHLTFGQLRLAEEISARVRQPDLRSIAMGSVALARNDSRAIVRHLRDYPGTDPFAIVLLVRGGDLTGARRLLDSPAFAQNPHHDAISAECEAAGGAGWPVRSALHRVITQIHPAGARRHLHAQTLARVLADAGDLSGAISVLEDAGRGREAAFNYVVHTGFYWMRAQKDLADLYRQAGRTEDARAIEDDLVAALIAADADYPLLVDLNSRRP